MSININNVNFSLATSLTGASGLDADTNKFFKLDRYLGDDIVLPYSFDEVKIKTNDLCIADNFNASLFKLYYNLCYLNAQSKIASNDIPTTYSAFYASSLTTGSSGIGYHNSSNSSDYLIGQLSAVGDGTTSSNTVLSALVDGAFTQSLGSKDKSVGFVANSASLIAFHSNPSNNFAELKINTRTIEDKTNLQFTEIKSLTINSKKELFVLDDTLIHKFDVTGVLTDNPAISGIGKLLIKTIGGFNSDILIKDKFSDPISIDTGKEDKIYVLDKGAGGYKVFDKDLNHIETVSKVNDFRTRVAGTEVVDLSVDKITEHVYVLTENGIIIEYDENNLFVDQYDNADSIADDEVFTKLTQSRKNDNILYVLTNKSMFKKFKSKLSKSIGSFKFESNRIILDKFTFVDVLDTDDLSKDFVFVGGEHRRGGVSNFLGTLQGDLISKSVSDFVDSDIGVVFQFDELVQYKTISREINKSRMFPLSSVYIDNEEYVSGWVVNKSLHKFLYNHELIIDSIYGKFKAQYDGLGRSEYVDIDYLTERDENLFNFNTDKNYFVGLNENILAETINRPLKMIYSLQESILKLHQEKYTNVYPNSDHITGIKI